MAEFNFQEPKKPQCINCFGYKTHSEMVDLVLCIECYREQQAEKSLEDRVLDLELTVRALRNQLSNHSHLSNMTFGRLS